MKTNASRPPRHLPAGLPLLLILFAASGCAALIYEIIWFQLLELVIGSSSLSLGVLLGVFMGGMCLGSWLLPRLLTSARHPLQIFAMLELGIGVMALLLLWGLPIVSGLYATLGSGLSVRLLVATVCLLPPTVMMGATLPAVSRWVGTSASALPWVNGPNRPLEAPNPGLLAWSGDSRGWVASRVDLSSYAGRAISPQFTLHTDSAVGFTGWFLDDIEVYTCKPSPLVAGKVVVKGRAQRGKKLTASASGWPAGTTLAFSWLRNGMPIAKATKGTLKLGRKDVGKKISVRVTGSKAGYLPSSVVSKRTKRVLR